MPRKKKTVGGSSRKGSDIAVPVPNPMRQRDRRPNSDTGKSISNEDFFSY